jgi:gliding motility-associated-like protein
LRVSSTIAKQITIKVTLASVLLFAYLNSTAQYTKLYSFTGGTEATSPIGTLITDGTYLYGVTIKGGAADMGTVYRTKQDGTAYVKLLDFTGTNGNYPEGSLYYDGTSLYGMTYKGGANDMGVIYKMKPDGTNYQKLLDFNGTNGQGPYGVFVSDGTYLYAMTWEGGANNMGRVFRILPDGTGYQGLLDFAGAANGSYPGSSLYYDYDDGVLYGMTSQGGTNGFGTVFKINPNGSGYTQLHDFATGADGREPYGAVISDGTYLYGLTYSGGTSGNGTIFRIEPDGTNYSKLHDFAGASTGIHPYTTLALHGSSLYGVTNDDGSTNNFGMMFKINRDGSGFTKLIAFFGTSNGSDSDATLSSIGPYLYGTTSTGGTSGNGTIFKYEVTEPFTKLLDFTGSFNGLSPRGSLYSDGTYLYGTTEEGGANDMGTIFKMKPDGTGYVKLLDFAGSSNGRNPKGSLISDGTSLYGMTSTGGSNNQGTVFKILPDGTGYTKLHDFTTTPLGVFPQGDLYYDGTALYGMTSFGGANNRGTFFKVNPDGSAYAKLSDFGAPFDGNQPVSSLYSDGTFFYGTTNRGGSANMGTMFRIKPDGSGLTKLLDFGVGTNGRYPEGSFTSDATYLYGTTSEGGTNNYGTLFKIKPDGTGYATILDFDNNVYGSTPEDTPLLVGEFLYALTFVGGPNFEGTIFKIKTDGTNYKTVYEFSKTTSGNYPEGNSLITDGTYFYGMLNNGGLTQGTVFRLKDVPENNTLVNFTGASNGRAPLYAKLTCDGTSLYGMTSRGGTNDRGVIFKMSSDGATLTKLYEFAPSPDGAQPYGSLYKDGTVFYGMTIQGGTTNHGTIFKINNDGSGYSKLYNFNGAATGTDPFGAVTSDGTYLYGVTSAGGLNGRGTIFKILKDGTGFVKLYDFPANSGFPVGDPILIGSTLYGTTYYGGTGGEGTIFKIQTDGTGYTSIHDFIYPAAVRPYSGALVYDGTYLYGTTELGGSTDDGVVFKIKLDGTGYVALHDFHAPVGEFPLAGLEMAGNSLYGFTDEGGANDMGTLFKINPDGSGYQTLMEFDGVINGYEVLSTPCFCGDALYGMTASGGINDYGTIFKYVLPAIAPAIPSAIVNMTVNGGNQADGSTLTYSSLVIGNNELKDIVITNSGTATLSISDIQLTGDFAIAGTAPTSILVGENKTVSIRFTPTAAGTRTGTMTFLSNGTTPSYVINLSGVGINQTRLIGITENAVSLANNSALDFSSANVGVNVLKDLLITNSGNSTLTVIDIQTTGDFTITSSIPTSIGPGLNATVTVRFTPTLPGARTGTFTVSSNGDVPSYIINLSGAGNLTRIISITESAVALANNSSLNFPSANVGASVVKNLVISNSGNSALTITNIQVTGDFSITTAVPSSIGPGLNATIAVSFTPTVSGARSGTFTVTSNGNIPTYVINLSGTGIALTPIIKLTENAVTLSNNSNLDFSSAALGSDIFKNLVITNSGNATLTITSIQTTGDFAFTSAAPSSISAGLTATITVRFTPTAAGSRTGTLTISSNSDIPTYVLNLSGSGISPAPIIEVVAGGIGQSNGSDLAFSSTNIGSDELKDLVITNSGTATLTITNIQVTGDFQLEGNIPSTIPPKSNATITIRFTPTALGARTGTLTILNNGNTPAFVINLKGEGGTEIEVYNVVTTNPNGQHDFLKIKNITFFPNNSVFIFDRWGNKVYETKKYDNADNVFKGLTDKGRDLPEGTYYYAIYKNNGDKPFTGFILLRR